MFIRHNKCESRRKSTYGSVLGNAYFSDWLIHEAVHQPRDVETAGGGGRIARAGEVQFAGGRPRSRGNSRSRTGSPLRSSAGLYARAPAVDIWDLHCHLSGIAGRTPDERMARLVEAA